MGVLPYPRFLRVRLYSLNQVEGDKILDLFADVGPADLQSFSYYCLKAALRDVPEDPALCAGELPEGLFRPDIIERELRQEIT